MFSCLPFSTPQVTTEGIRCVSKISQLKKRKASPLEAPSAKRTRCDELLATLQDFQKVQLSQLQSLHWLAQQPLPHAYVSTTPARQGKLPPLEEAFTSFVMSYKAVEPTERQKRMRALKANITDETSLLFTEILSLLSSDTEVIAHTSEDSDGGDLDWLMTPTNTGAYYM